MNTQDQPEQPSGNVSSITRVTRKQRRAQQTLERRFRKRAVAHHCVLDRDCTEAGVAVEIDNAQEFHKLHTARGEPTCSACPVCEQFRVSGKPPTKFSAGERAGIELQWRGRLAEAKAQAQQEAKLNAELTKACPGGFPIAHGVPSDG